MGKFRYAENETLYLTDYDDLLERVPFETEYSTEKNIWRQVFIKRRCDDEAVGLITVYERKEIFVEIFAPLKETDYYEQSFELCLEYCKKVLNLDKVFCKCRKNDSEMYKILKKHKFYEHKQKLENKTASKITETEQEIEFVGYDTGIKLKYFVCAFFFIRFYYLLYLIHNYSSIVNAEFSIVLLFVLYIFSLIMTALLIFPMYFYFKYFFIGKYRKVLHYLTGIVTGLLIICSVCSSTLPTFNVTYIPEMTGFIDRF